MTLHGALRAVGSIPGAPVCGNRIWEQSSTIFVQRDTASGSVEPIATALSTPIDWVAPLQGGHTIFYRSNFNRGELIYDAAQQSWSNDVATAAADWSNVTPEQNASFNLVSATSEGGDSVIVLTWPLENYRGGAPMDINVMVPDTITFDTSIRHTFVTIQDTVGPIIGAFAPQGGRIFITVPTADGTDIEQLDTHLFTPTLIHTFTGRKIYGLAMNELETEYVVTSGDSSQTILPNGLVYGGDCRIEYYDTAFQLLQQTSAPGSCVFDFTGTFWGGTGTFAADVIKSSLRLLRPGNGPSRPRVHW